jgi:hypothetical protein
MTVVSNMRITWGSGRTTYWNPKSAMKNPNIMFLVRRWGQKLNSRGRRKENNKKAPNPQIRKENTGKTPGTRRLSRAGMISIPIASNPARPVRPTNTPELGPWG